MDTALSIKEIDQRFAMSGKRGMTLLELVMAAAMVGLVGLAFAGLYGTAQRFLLQETDMAMLQSEVSFAMEHITRTGLPATDVRDKSTGSKKRLWFKTDISGDQDTSNDVWRLYEWDSTPNSDRILYYYEDPSTGASPPNNPTVPYTERVARRIQSFQFAVNASQILVTVTITSEQGMAPEPATVTFDISPRSMQSSS